MLMRSTGLGRTELEGYVNALDVKEDYVIINMKTVEPVKWKVRVAADFSDLMTMTRLLIFSVKGWKFLIVQFFKVLFRPLRKDKTLTRPDDF